MRKYVCGMIAIAFCLFGYSCSTSKKANTENGLSKEQKQQERKEKREAREREANAPPKQEATKKPIPDENNKSATQPLENK